VAKIAIEAALTGHLVFTSLHTNDASGAITRLQEMGIEGFLIAASSIAIINQRIIRQLCFLCRETYQPAPQELDLVGFSHRHGDQVEWYRPVGCEHCTEGYKGRVGIYEVLMINDELRDLIASGATKAMIRYAAKQGGMITLKEYAMRLIAHGYTSYEELVRVVYTNEGQEKLCSTCRNVVGEEFLKCPYCQNDLRQVCPNCQRAINDAWISCPSCGHMLIENLGKETVCHQCKMALDPAWKGCPQCVVPVGEHRRQSSCSLEG